jgi:hypothetical protein
MGHAPVLSPEKEYVSGAEVAYLIVYRDNLRAS